ncbi:NADP-dependent oxidoreductase [Streptosporangium carneum]|uniref:Zinc-binding alcohol dehydrogenase n=2 Tax=Streptosporangium carneum TaxID=47481 RepID=A0A9W6HZY0_9ACTN|nr:NADP-dependent oxidoreductase [Streptosporangium carneum]GLK09142.1 zinc-binding alcohol dehydrogenase [Streptosporangium carneum]
MVQAIGVTQPGGPDALGEFDLVAEPIGPGQVRIRVSSATVNPTDTMIRSRPRQDEADAVRVPGMEVAGVITEIGPAVDRPFAIGDAVMAIVVPSGAHGGYRADLVVSARSVAKIPAGLSDVQAATIPMNGLTARLALDTLALPSGATVAVTGAAGTVGGYFVQLAKQAGLVVVADAARQDETFVRECGADEVVPRGDDFAAMVRRHHPGGVDGLVDAAVLEAAVLPAVKDGGAVVTLRGYQGDGTDRVRVTPIFVRDYVEAAAELDRLAELAGEGRLTVRVAGQLPASRAGDAHRSLERRGVRGRFVLRFG